jgi:hypothetical protein
MVFCASLHFYGGALRLFEVFNSCVTSTVALFAIQLPLASPAALIERWGVGRLCRIRVTLD